MLNQGKKSAAPPKYCVKPIALLSSAAVSSAHAIAGQKRRCRPIPAQIATPSAAPSQGNPSRKSAHQCAAVPQAASATPTLAASNAAAQRFCGAANSASTPQQNQANNNGCTAALGPAANGSSQGRAMAKPAAMTAAWAARPERTETLIEKDRETSLQAGAGKPRRRASPPRSRPAIARRCVSKQAAESSFA